MMKEIIARTLAPPMTGEIQAPRVPVSWGELIDKITILELKRDRIENEDALRNVCHELSLLQAAAQPVLAAGGRIAELKSQLAAVNEKLWQLEDLVREKETSRGFDSKFVELARSICKLNDERSMVKREINVQLKSAIVEEKSYRTASS